MRAHAPRYTFLIGGLNPPIGSEIRSTSGNIHPEGNCGGGGGPCSTSSSTSHTLIDSPGGEKEEGKRTVRYVRLVFHLQMRSQFARDRRWHLKPVPHSKACVVN